MESGVESAVAAADAALFNAAKNADATADMIAFLKVAAQADADYASALAANLGAYQVAWRQGVLGTLPSGSPLVPVWTKEIAWAGAVAGARNAYVSALGGAGMTYTNTVLDAYGVFNDAAWSAASAYNSSANTVGSAYSSAMRSANRAYAQSQFNAEKVHTTALFSAAKDESLANAALDMQIAKGNATATQSEAAGATAKIDTLMSLLGNLGQGYTFTNWLNDAQTTSTTLTADNAAAVIARNGRITQGNQQIAIAKVVNAATKLAKDVAAKNQLEYANGLSDANVNIAAYGAYTAYVSSMKGVQSTYQNNLVSAYTANISAGDVAWNKFAKTATALGEAYVSAIERINLDPNFDGVAHINQAASSVAAGQPSQALSTQGNQGGKKESDWRYDALDWWADWMRWNNKEVVKAVFPSLKAVDIVTGVDATSKVASFLPNPAEDSKSGLDIYDRMRGQGNGVLWSLYGSGGTMFGSVAGVTGASYAFDGTSPYTGQQLSGGERAFQTVLGSLQLGTIGFGGAKLIVPKTSAVPKIVAPKPDVRTIAKQEIGTVETIIGMDAPPGYTTVIDTSLFGREGTNLASAARTKHILTGDATGGGHLFPGNPGKTPFPPDWDAQKVMHAVSDVATHPNSVWTSQTGSGGMFTKSGKPAKFVVVGEFEGIEIKVVVQPMGEGIITAHPLQ